ncbi:High-affnity carbon uptake protein Hat/HatR [Actinokineospora spheciospongiae]|uniref:High-affnity carbon uptake protein Hat/HatR n=1 Tax=Actinokineospora spheciospongiae TaxID=909613 RepID=W7J554_9PSEU|nr:caspase family protein [Actinokineospora spheciospongiae]EWC64162.1 High-affnity carbon uptake protein Hat/HatR [Actinokineospora spheciospongiae]
MAAERPTGAAPGARRHLLTGVVRHYRHDESLNRDGLIDDQRRVVDFFAEFDYEHLPVIPENPTRAELLDALREFSFHGERRPDDFVVLYLAGHGDVLPGGPYGGDLALLMADVDPLDIRPRSVKITEVAESMLAETRVHRLLLVVDACFSGQAAVDFTRAIGGYSGDETDLDLTGERYGHAVIGATLPNQLATQGVFTRALTDALRDLRESRGPQAPISLDDIQVELHQRMPPAQRTNFALLARRSSGIPDFLSGPDRRPAARPAEPKSRRRLREEELRERFFPHVGEFVGRVEARREVVRWLADPADGSPIVVVGDPGSGKTTLLGWLAAVCHPEYAPMAARDGHPTPGMGAIDAAVHAGGRTGVDVLAAIAAAGGIAGIDEEAGPHAVMPAVLAELRDRETPLVVLVDALDEASQPTSLVEDVLIPLSTGCAGRVRLLLGARPRVLAGFAGTAHVRVDLDSPRFADPGSLRRVVRRRLVRDREGLDEDQVEAVTAVIAEVAGRSFYLACLVADKQGASDGLPDPADPVWRSSLPRDTGTAMREDLVGRLGGGAERAIDLLRPLAYAQGGGLPWEAVWLALANALDPGGGHRATDLLDVRGNAASYVVPAGQLDGRALFRLFHKSLADLLLAGRDEVEDERRIVTALVAGVPRHDDGTPDWAAAHPYVRTHLVGHAVRAGRIDELVRLPGFLLVAEPVRLLSALDRTVGAPARAAANAYRRALPALRAHGPQEGPAHLGLAARCVRADRFADAIAVDHASWRARWAAWQPQHPHVPIRVCQGAINAVAVAAVDGRHLVVSGSEDGVLRVWDGQTGALFRQPVTAHADAVNALAVTRSGTRQVIVSAGSDARVTAWDLKTGEPVGRPLRAHTGGVRAVAVVVLDGEAVVVSAGDDLAVHVSRLGTDELLGPPFRGHRHPVTAIACDPGGTTAASADEGGRVLVWGLWDDTPTPVELNHPRSVRTVGFAEVDGHPVVVTGCHDTKIRVWDPRTGSLVREPITGHSRAVLSVAAGVVGGRPVVASGSASGTIRVFDRATHAEVGDAITGHSGPVRALAFATFGTRPVVVSGSADGTVRIWDVGAPDLDGDPFAGAQPASQALAVTTLDDCPVVIAGGTGSTVRVWDLETGITIRRAYAGHRRTVTAVAAARTGSRHVVVSGDAGGEVHVWDLVPPGSAARHTTHRQRVTGLCVAELAGEAVVVSGSLDRTVRVRSLASGAEVGEPYRASGSAVRCLAVGRLGAATVVIIGEDRVVRVWDLATRTPVGRPFAEHEGNVSTVALVEDAGRSLVVSGDERGTVRVWDLAGRTADGQPFHGHDRAVRALAHARVGGRRVVFSGGADQAVHAWDLGTGAPVGRGSIDHGDRVGALVVADLDHRPTVVSGGVDNPIGVWDAATGAERFGRHSHWVRAVAVGPLGNRPVVASGSVDATLRIWDLESGRPVSAPLRGHTRGVRDVVVARFADGRSVLVSGGDDQSVRAWEPVDGVVTGRQLGTHSDWVRALAVSEVDGVPVVVSGGDTTVRTWSLDGGGADSPPYTGHTAWIRAVATSRLAGGEPVVVSAAADAAGIHVWDVVRKEPVSAPFDGHAQPVRALTAVDFAGRRVVVSADDGGTVLAWDLETGELVADPLTRRFPDVGVVTTATPAGRVPVAGPDGVRVVVAARGRAHVLRLSTAGRWRAECAVDAQSDVLSAALYGRDSLVLGCELGVVAIRLATW